ncbi:unnamed protein product [Ceutorhynchus assimilis]|uniref:Uncharacterized protein n=1 Tax=Ceutorhynchus assimilis TaxID=467358 RepID=A0A9N9QEX9_9CUCU|nr:unnamed protein product [Ceutorhynchus assimilis]
MDLSAYLAAPLQLDKVCRACLMVKGNMRPLFGACLDEMLASFTGIQISQNDGFPRHMCVQCVLQCSRAYTFKQLYEKSNAILRQFVSKEFQDNLKKYQEQEKSRNQAKKELEEQLKFRSPSPVRIMLEEPKILENECVSFETVVTSQGHFMQKTEIDDEFYAVVETVEEIGDDEGSLGDMSNEEKNYKIDLATLNAMTSPEPPVTKQKKSSKYSCPKCDAQFPLRVDLKIHMMIHPKDLNYICNTCNKAFAEARILRRHQKIHLEHKPHQCDQCPMSFSESSNLSKHKKKHTGELRNIKGKPYLCSVCGRAFKWSSSLHKHMKYHTGHKLLNCNYCPKQYVEARSLKIHMRSHTGERPYVCNICNKSFTQTCNLEKHIRVHTGEKPYTCPVCNKGFSQSGYVSIHMRTHTGDRPYVCRTCDRAFSGSNTLNLHQRTHTGEKPYNCEICGKNFSRQETLTVHIRTHTGDRPHVCNICHRGFTSSGQLSGHMKTHTGEKPHACKVCDRKFSGSSSLKVHMKYHQPIQKKEEVVQAVQYTCKLCNKNFEDDTAFNTHILDVHDIQAATIQIKGDDLENFTEIITSDNQTIQVQTISQME